MNRERRKAIAALQVRLADLESEANAIAEEIGTLQEEEQESFDNLPEGLQQSERGQATEAAAEALDEAKSAAEEIANYASEATAALDTASE